MSPVAYGSRWLAIAMVLLSSLWSAPIVAQNYPSKPIRFIVPFPPGGGTDTVARAISQRLAERLGQQVVIDNRSGANAIIGMRYDANDVAPGVTEVLAYGTAVVIDRSAN